MRGLVLCRRLLRQNSTDMAPKYITRPAAAEWLTDRGIKVKTETLARWACNGRYALPLIRIGRIIRYDVDDLDELIRSHKIVPGGDESS